MTKRYSYFDFSGPFLKGYDRFNHVASAGLDYYWRYITARKLNRLLKKNKWPGRILDLACGTGDMAAAVCRRSATALVYGSDPSADMLGLGAQKKRKAERSRFHMIRAVHQLPFAANSLDAVTCAFGVRNFTQLQEDVRECFRLLRPGGRIYLLDFYRPKNRFTQKLLNLYSASIAPGIGFLLTGLTRPYRYLIASMYAFKTADEMMHLLEEIGFRAVEIRPFFFHLVHVVVAEKAKEHS
jgi:demethylmenaquinone methyltransferase / 2-methoxy-6-polyprenyl-1,4-benzoquinol methylase